MEIPETVDPNRFAQALFTPLPGRYDRLAALLSMGQDGRWRRAMIDHIVAARPGTVLDVATGPAGVALQLAGPDPGTGGRRRPHPRACCARAGQRGTAWPGQPGPAGRRTGRAAPLPRPDLRRPHLHLPPPLRRRPPGHAGRAGPGGETGRRRGQPRVPGAAEPVLAVLVVGVHPAGAAAGRPPHRRPSLVRASGGSSARTSPPTTGGIRCRGPSGPGNAPASSTSACGR